MTVESAEPLRLSEKDLEELSALTSQVDKVELKLTVRQGERRATLHALEAELLDAELRHVYFFDTADLALYQAGVIVRGRDRPGDSVVKLRHCDPATLEPSLRAAKRFRVELDATPRGYVCTASYGRILAPETLRNVVERTRPVSDVLSSKQRLFLRDHAPARLTLDDLTVLGPVHVMKLKASPRGLRFRYVVELWIFPDGSRLLELSIRCKPQQVFGIATEARGFLSERGLCLDPDVQTKTGSALAFFAGQVTV
jgi:hypothetical protein